MGQNLKEPFEFQTDNLRNNRKFNHTLQNIFLNEYGDLNTPKLYTILFNTIPNVFIEEDLLIEPALEWLMNMYSNEINDVIYNKKNDTDKNTSKYDDIFFLLYDDTLIHFNTNRKEVRILFHKTDYHLIEKIASGIRAFKEKDKSSIVFLLTQTAGEICLHGIKLAKNNIDVTINYNDDFKPIHEIITQRLSTPDDKGILLLHGIPGTGKTSYLRHIISKTNKPVIFIPHTMAQALTSPDFMPLLVSNKNSILVIEDAENIIIDRNSDGNSPVSAILNLSDGLLSDCLKLQIICTFNSDFTKIDSALTRKGRLIAQYEFKKLTTDKANILAQSLGKEVTFEEPMTLTDIYNTEEISFNKVNEKHQIGFGHQRKVG